MQHNFSDKMTNNLLIFIPQSLCSAQSGYVLGKVVHDVHNNLKKFYIISVREAGFLDLTKSTLDTVGYYSNINNSNEFSDRKYSDWIHIVAKSYENGQQEYYPTNIVINNKRINLSVTHTTIILYNKCALQETELFESKAASGDHFYELAKLIQGKKDELKIKSRFVRTWETLWIYNMICLLYLVLLLSKVTEKLLLILKYSSLGLHVHSWLENIKWMLVTVIRNRGFKLKTGNYALAILIDMALGIFVLKLLQYYIKDQPSQLLLNNAEASNKNLSFICHLCKQN